jgi:hypothetical protein
MVSVSPMHFDRHKKSASESNTSRTASYQTIACGCERNGECACDHLLRRQSDRIVLRSS